MFFNLPFSPLNKGIDLMRKNELSAAIAYFKGLISSKVLLGESYFNIGRCYFKIGDISEAKKNLHNALDNQFTEEIIKDVLEITNWKLLCSYNYYNNWPTFSSDSKKLAFVSVRKDTNGDGLINSTDRGGIYLINLTTFEEKYIVTDDYYNFHPKFSPDGKYLTYLSVRKFLPDKDIVDTKANPGLYLFDLETDQETELLSDKYRPKNYTFTDDSKKIILACWIPGNNGSGIYALDIAEKKTIEIVPGLFENTFPSMSKDGQYLLFSTWRRDTNGDGQINFRDNSAIFLKNLKSYNEFEIVSDRYNNMFPSYSHDGKKVLFLSYRRDTNKDGLIDSLDNPGIYYYDLTKQKEVCVVDDKFFNKFPSFTADDKNVVFLSSWRKVDKADKYKDYFEHKGVYMINIDTNKIKRIVSDKYYGCYYPVVSPDGQKTAYVSWRKDTRRGLYLASLNGYPSKEELHKYIDDNI
ncbi:MAG: hypothetical protein LHV68_07615 [Elusimicrobia bacterium]|nr:hypothetical protein [Candidatus Liberimonas magnetica]